MTETASLLDKCIEAALDLAATRRWQDITLAEIAEKAALSLADLHGVADKQTISEAVESHLDAAMCEGSLDPDETARTRLFDVIMLRFEAMEDRRDGVMSFLRWRDSSLAGLALRVRARGATARWALACAGLDRSGQLPPHLQRVGLAWIIAQAERAWRGETSSDLTATMAALDGELLKAESRLEWLSRRGGSSAQADADGDA